MSQWYYVSGNHKIGPISSDQMQYLIGEAEILPDTLVWREGMSGWSRASDMILQGIFRGTAARGCGIAAGSVTREKYEAIRNIGRVEWAFKYYCIGTAAYYLLGCMPLMLYTQSLSGDMGIGFFLIAVLCSIIGTVLAILILILLYYYWVSIQDGHARTTPKKAVGYLFIPVFNIYWGFVVSFGLARDMNAYAWRHDVRNVHVHEGLVLAPFILWIAGMVSSFFLGLQNQSSYLAGQQIGQSVFIFGGALALASICEMQICVLGILRQRLGK